MPLSAEERPRAVVVGGWVDGGIELSVQWQEALLQTRK